MNVKIWHGDLRAISPSLNSTVAQYNMLRSQIVIVVWDACQIPQSAMFSRRCVCPLLVDRGFRYFASHRGPKSFPASRSPGDKSAAGLVF